MDPAISVVIPAYNAARFVSQALESVLSQTHQTLEAIVIDDGSIDETATIVRSFADPRVRLLSGPNRGVARARNRGIHAANGEAVAFLDADDVWFPEKIATQLGVLQARSALVAVGSLMRYQSISGRTLGIAGQEIRCQDTARLRAGRLMPFPLSSLLVWKPILDSVGYFDESLDDLVPGQVEDLDLIARLAQSGDVFTIPKVLGAYRVHAGSASSRDLSSQYEGARFVQARLAAQLEGKSLTWDNFRAEVPNTLKQRYQDRVRAYYRAAGLKAAESKWVGAFVSGVLALVLGPRYTLRRLMRQRGSEHEW